MDLQAYIMEFVTEQPVLAAALAVIVGLLVVVNVGAKNKEPAPAAVTKDVAVSNSGGGGGGKKGKKKKANKSKKSNGANNTTNGSAAPVVVAAPEEEEESEPEPAPAPAPSKKKKKKKSAPAAAAKVEEPVVVVKEPEPVKEVVPEPAPAASTSSKKKKKKKKKNNGAAAAATADAATDAAPSEEKKVDSDDDDDDMLAAFAKGSREKKKKTVVDDDDWSFVNKNKGKSKKGYGGDAAAIKAANDIDGADPGDALPEFLQMKIETADIPVIIGPKGATIQHIQLMTGATVDIDKGFLVVKVKGESVEHMRAALQMIQEVLSARKAKTAHSATLSGADIKGSDGVKAIIGKGGSKIKEIQSSTACKIDADIDNGTVVIAGPTEAAVKDAVQMCKDAVFGASNCTIDLKSKSMVFCICGRSFKDLQSLQTQTGARLDMTGSVLTISGDVENVQQAFSIVSAKMIRCKGTTLVIDKNIGGVMGKGGANIRQIQDTTGAFVEIGKDNECKIVGEPDAVKAAEISIRKAMAGEIELKAGEVLERVELGAGTSMVIGTRGAKIKELQTEHGIQINVQITTATLVGKKDKVAKAKTAILAIVTPYIERAKAEMEAQQEAEKLVAAGDTTWTGDDMQDVTDGW